MSLKFIVLSDLHILPEGDLSYSLETTERLVDGITAINERHADADFVVLAGDLADKGDIASYQRLHTVLQDLKVPLHVTIGNHDSRDNFLEVFGEQHKAETGFVDLVVDIKGYRVIVLDSAEEGTSAGKLRVEQLIWLKTRLAEAADKPVIVIVHHHANPLYTRVDRIKLENGEEFVNVLKGHPDVRNVIAGHVHYTSTAVWKGIPFTTLAGSHYSVTIPLDAEAHMDVLSGPGQMAVVLADEDQTLTHFDNYIDDHRALM